MILWSLRFLIFNELRQYLLKHFKLLTLTLFIWLLVACQPQTLLVEVTRIVADTPEPIVYTQDVEVTREVPVEVEVTRVVVETLPPEEMPVEVTKTPLGTPSRPIQLLFPAIADTNTMNTRLQPLVQMLEAETGASFSIGILDSEQAVLDLMCSAPEETVGFISAGGFALAEANCGAQVGNVAIDRNGLWWQAGMIVARPNLGIYTLEDLAGRTGAVPDLASIPNSLAVQLLLQQNGIEPTDLIEIPSDSSAMIAVFDADVEFAVATYLPPILPYEEELWQYGEDTPETWRRLGILPTRSPIGYVLVNGEPEFGGYQIRDARARIFDVYPDIFSKTRIIALTPQIPNETVAFGGHFPLGLARELMDAFVIFGNSEMCADSLCASDFYNWRGLQLADSSAYDPLRELMMMWDDPTAVLLLDEATTP